MRRAARNLPLDIRFRTKTEQETRTKRAADWLGLVTLRRAVTPGLGRSEMAPVRVWLSEPPAASDRPFVVSQSSLYRLNSSFRYRSVVVPVWLCCRSGAVLFSFLFRFAAGDVTGFRRRNGPKTAMQLGAGSFRFGTQRKRRYISFHFGTRRERRYVSWEARSIMGTRRKRWHISLEGRLFPKRN